MRLLALVVAIAAGAALAAADPPKPKLERLPASATAASGPIAPAAKAVAQRGKRGKRKPPRPKPPHRTANKVRADKLFADGRRYLEAKEYALACTAFEQSHQADPAIGTQLNIALCYEDWGKIAAAYRAYVEAERLAKEKSDDREQGARRKVDELAPQVPHLQFDLPADADPGAVFLFDGKQITRAELADDLLVDPGTHEIEARVAGKPPTRTAVELRLGERKRITIEVPKPKIKVLDPTPPRNKRRLYGGIGLVAGGTLTIGIASFVALVARQDYADAIASCPMLVCESRADFEATQRARDRATYMTFVGIGGAALVGAGVYYILTSRGKPVETRRVELRPVIGPTGVGIALGGRL